MKHYASAGAGPQRNAGPDSPRALPRFQLTAGARGYCGSARSPRSPRRRAPAGRCARARVLRHRFGEGQHLHAVDPGRDGGRVADDAGPDLVPALNAPEIGPRLRTDGAGLAVLVERDDLRSLAKGEVPLAAPLPDPFAENAADRAALVVVDQALVRAAVLGAAQEDPAVGAEVIPHLKGDLAVAELLLGEQQPAVARRILAAGDRAVLDHPAPAGAVAARLAVRGLRRGLPARQRLSVKQLPPAGVGREEARTDNQRDGGKQGECGATIHGDGVSRISVTGFEDVNRADAVQLFARARLRALTIALMEASSMLVSIPAPKSDWPRSVRIWM